MSLVRHSIDFRIRPEMCSMCAMVGCEPPSPTTLSPVMGLIPVDDRTFAPTPLYSPPVFWRVVPLKCPNLSDHKVEKLDWV